MKKVLLLLVLLGVAIYVASWFWAGDDVAAAAAKPWPDGLGTLAAVPDRYPPQEENEAARKLTELAAPIAGNEAVRSYVRQEIARGDLTIAPPPAMADVSAVRDLLLHEPVVWKRDLSRQHGGHLPKVAMCASLTRALVASALARAGRHDPAAWDDLHAAWNLTKSVDAHPALILRIVSMSMTRTINAVAWKMPLPVPAWFDEVQKHDFVRPLFETLQCEKWRLWSEQKFPVKALAESIEQDRSFTHAIARVTECEFHPGPPHDPGHGLIETPNLDITWQRAFRYRVEREATANVLRARAGQPIETGSHCSDGEWSFDGKTLRFTKPIPLPEQRDKSMPLTLRVRD